MNDRSGDIFYFAVGVAAVAFGILAYTYLFAEGWKQPPNAAGAAQELNLDDSGSGMNRDAE